MDFYNSTFAMIFANGKSRWAVTMPWGTHYSVPKEEVTASWRRHEECHKRQWRQYWFVGFAILYLWYLATVGYEQNPFEIEARKAATEGADDAG